VSISVKEKPSAWEGYFGVIRFADYSNLLQSSKNPFPNESSVP